MKQPPLITYNLKDRGRNFTGKDRKFNIRAIVDYINGDVFQEKVKNRSVVGYFGHYIRAKFGLTPKDNVVIGGNLHDLEPALVTTSIKGRYDGTIEHQTEFINNGPGIKASNMFSSNIGGFSSAINEIANTFHGFDWVYDPNFTTNRGYTLDSAGDESGEVAEYIAKEESLFFNDFVTRKDSKIELLQAALDSAEIENEQYLSMLSAQGIDGDIDTNAIIPYTVALDSTAQMHRDAVLFNNIAALPSFIEGKEKPKTDRDYDKMKSRLGIGG